ncbi:MAG: phosphoribosyltransferase family protein [Calditrichaceae bacterium]|jgi:putative phosphoribosyl transferase
MFHNRKDAGKSLASSLNKYKNDEAIILAIPRGGVEVGYEVAKSLNVDFSILVSRKLPMPDNPESGFGAVAEDGSLFMINEAEKWLSKNAIDRIISEQKNIVKDRIKSLRNDEPLPDLKNKTVILVDDGIAMGSTMRASIKLCKKQEAGKIIVAVPVTDKRVRNEIAALVDEIIVLETPPVFRAVAQVYENWYDVSDREVLNILRD